MASCPDYREKSHPHPGSVRHYISVFVTDHICDAGISNQTYARILEVVDEAVLTAIATHGRLLKLHEEHKE